MTALAAGSRGQLTQGGPVLRRAPLAEIRRWAYDCLHRHVRKHFAMLGPWCAGPALFVEGS